VITATCMINANEARNAARLDFKNHV
jgi:hypothetical protein